jgi:allophanate hydrolase
MQKQAPAPDRNGATPGTTTGGTAYRASPLRLSELRRGYAERLRTPTDVAKSVLESIAARGDDGVWISTVEPDELYARATELERIREHAGGRLYGLPLFGVPFAVKDNIDVAGLPTTAACPDFAYRPQRTGPVVERLLSAGAMLVGKTNLDQFATGLTGSRSPYGAVESVFGGGLIAGGSSSGSAVAVAAGLVAFALGTDTAGSGRVPAALNGIVGLKPTRGLLSTLGVVPACRSLDCVSIFAHDVSDAAAVLATARGRSPEDPWGRSLPRDRVRPRPPATLRLGVPAAEDLDFFGDVDQRHRFALGRDRAGSIVAEVVPVEIEALLEAGDLLYQGPWVAERLADLEAFLLEHPDSVLDVTRQILQSGRRFDAAELFRAQHRLRELQAWTERLWERVDAILLPTIGTTFTLTEIAEQPVRHNTALGRYTQFANLLDLAVVTIPNGMTADGRPASMSVIGPAYSDATMCQLAAALEATPVTTTPATPATPPVLAASVQGTITLAVVGRHLRGESRNGELLDRGAAYLRTASTAPTYRLYRLPVAGPDGRPAPDGLPGLVRVPTDGCRIEVELWDVPAGTVGSLLAGVPAPLSLGWIRLDTGESVLGFLCESYAAVAAGGAGAEAAVGPGPRGGTPEDISAYGGWRAYRAAGGS